MFKKILVALSVIIVGGAAFAAFYYTQVMSKPLAVEDVLPDGAVFFWKLEHSQEAFERLASTKLGRNIQNLNYEAFLKNLPSPAGEESVLQNIKDQWANFVTSVALKRIFGKEVALAVYPVDITQIAQVQPSPEDIPAVVQGIFENFYFVTRVGSDVKLLESLKEFIGDVGEQYSEETVKYKDRELHVLTLTNSQLKLTYVRIKDLVVFGLGDKAAKSAVDVDAKEHKALAFDERLKRVKLEGLKDQTMLGYWDMRSMVEFMKTQAANFPASGGGSSQQLEEAYNQMSGFDFVGFSGGASGSVDVTKSNLYYDISQMDPEIASLYTKCRSVENKSLAFVPAKVLYYQWGACLDAPMLWRQFHQGFDQANSSRPDPGSGEDQDLRSMLMPKVDFENTLLPSLGDEVGGYLSGIEVTDTFPIPQAAIFVKIADRAKFDEFISSLTKQPIIPVRQENYSGTEIQYLSTPFGEALEPAFAYIGDYFFFTTQRKLAHDSLDARAGSSGLTADESFQALGKGLTEPSTGLQYINVHALAPKLVELTEWVDDWANAQDLQRQAFQAGSTRRLDDKKNEAALLGKDINDQVIKKDDLEKEIARLKSVGEPSGVKEAELAGVNALIDSKTRSLEAAEDEVKDLEKLVANFSPSAGSGEVRQAVIDQFLMPILDGLSSNFISSASRSRMTDDNMEVMFYLILE